MSGFTGENSGEVESNIAVTPLSEDDVTIKNGNIVLPPVKFTVTASCNGKRVEITQFGGYVERLVEIPASVDPTEVTTAVVIGEDGAERQVPTSVFKGSDGKYYASIHSLTNSVYVLIYNQAAFTDADGKWYEGVVNEMGSRLIINGIGNGLFDGDRGITRAEFAAILVRAPGLSEDGSGTVFSDASSGSWYYGAVGKAYEYGLIEGVGDNKFVPEANITRQEAMLMIQRAAIISGFTGTTGDLSAFSDASDAARWNVGSGLIVGSNGLLRPQDEIGRAETATIVLRLL